MALTRIYTVPNDKENKGKMINNRSHWNFFKAVIHRRFKVFAEKSTMHGFNEIYHSKVLFCKIVWLMAVLFALTMSVIQVYRMVTTFRDSPFTTKIETLDPEDDLFYPPVKICYVHWKYWVDYEKMTKMGFDRAAALYALSYLTPIYTNSTFDLKKAERDFFDIIRKYNLENFRDFFLYIAADNPANFNQTELRNTKFEKYFSLYNLNDLKLCYIITSDKLKDALNQIAEKTMGIKKFGLRYNNKSTSMQNVPITDREHVFYVMSAFSSVSSNIMLKWSPRLKDIYWPPIFSVDGSPVSMAAIHTFSPKMTSYHIKLNAKVFKWQNLKRKPCNETMQSYGETLNSRSFECMIESMTNNSTDDMYRKYFYAINVGNLTFHEMYRMNINFDLQENSTRCQQEHHLAMASEYLYEQQNNCSQNGYIRACEEWIYESTVTATYMDFDIAEVGFPTMIYLEYPPPQSVLVFKEVPSETWESFIANVGGVLGLWLGASVLSFLQVLYLGCGCDKDS